MYICGKIIYMNDRTETRSITYNGEIIEYIVTIKKVKNINMRIAKDGTVYVSANAYVPDYRIDSFVIDNVPFIKRVRFKLEALTSKKIETLHYITGETISILGMPVQLEVVETNEKAHIKFDGSRLLSMFVKPGSTYADKYKLMDTFWRQLGEKVFYHWAQVVYKRFQQAGIDVPMPTVKQQRMKSRWGSCTPVKELIKMNMRLLEGPQAYIEYVMIHEFAHFKYGDHSKNFHHLVAQFLPDWKERKKSLNLYFAHRP